eukprot:COSAG02_NODE_24937_length_673_cov_1.848432_1_plen_94_part_10
MDCGCQLLVVRTIFEQAQVKQQLVVPLDQRWRMRRARWNRAMLSRDGHGRLCVEQFVAAPFPTASAEQFVASSVPTAPTTSNQRTRLQQGTKQW